MIRISLVQQSISQKRVRFASQLGNDLISEYLIAKVNDENTITQQKLRAMLGQLKVLEEKSQSNFGDDLTGPYKMLSLLAQLLDNKNQQRQEGLDNCKNPLSRFWYQKRHPVTDSITWGEFKEYFNESRHHYLWNQGGIANLREYGLITEKTRAFKDENFTQFGLTDLGKEFVRAGGLEGFKKEKVIG
jgi:hypothetical protein